MTVRVTVSDGRPPYERTFTRAFTGLQLGRIGAGRTTYHCLAARDHSKKVDVDWDSPA